MSSQGRASGCWNNGNKSLRKLWSCDPGGEESGMSDELQYGIGDDYSLRLESACIVAHWEPVGNDDGSGE